MLAARIELFSFMNGDGLGFAGYKAIVDLRDAFCDDRICRYELVVVELYDIPLLKVLQTAAFGAIASNYVYRQGEVGFVIAMKGDRTIGTLLHHAAYEHKEYDTTHAIQVAAACIGG